MSVISNMSEDAKSKIRVLVKVVLTLVLVFLSFYLLFQFLERGKNSYLKAEVSNRDYYTLLLKYENHLGSKHGAEFSADLKAALQDGIVTNAEYKKVTREDPFVGINTREYEKLYETAKPKLLEIFKSP